VIQQTNFPYIFFIVISPNNYKYTNFFCKSSIGSFIYLILFVLICVLNFFGCFYLNKFYKLLILSKLLIKLLDISGILLTQAEIWSKLIESPFFISDKDVDIKQINSQKNQYASTGFFIVISENRQHTR